MLVAGREAKLIVIRDVSGKSGEEEKTVKEENLAGMRSLRRRARRD